MFGPVLRSRARHAAVEALSFKPAWQAERIREFARGESAGASLNLSRPPAGELLTGIDSERLARLPGPGSSAFREVEDVVNWSVVPAPTVAWARQLASGLGEAAALGEFWEWMGVACRLDQSDPVASWRGRNALLGRRAAALTELGIRLIHVRGPGSDLSVGLLPSGRRHATTMVSASGVPFVPNLPSEEVFAIPDPDATEGYVHLTRPVNVSGRLLHDLTLRFQNGRLTAVDGKGWDLLAAAAGRDPGAGRLGEVALVDSESRVAAVGGPFGSTLLDENAASHLALGSGFPAMWPSQSVRASTTAPTISI